jgi:hypothetical protein
MSVRWLLVLALVQMPALVHASETPTEQSVLVEVYESLNKSPHVLPKAASASTRTTLCDSLKALRAKLNELLQKHAPTNTLLAARNYVQHRRQRLGCPVSGSAPGISWRSMLETHDGLLDEMNKCRATKCEHAEALRTALANNLRALLPKLDDPEIVDRVLEDVSVALPDDEIVDAAVTLIADPSVEEKLSNRSSRR